MEKIFVLLFLYQVKHFLADYPLQTEYMLGKFKDGNDFIVPLAYHTGTHAAFTFAIGLLFTHAVPFSIGIACFDFVCHFCMDRIKAGKRYLGRFKPLTAKEFPTASEEQKRHNHYFWWSLGFDQMFHHLTHYVIIAAIIFW